MSNRDNPNRNRIFIGRLNPEARSRDLEKFLREKGFSKLKDVNIKLGYAFVEFEDKRDADDAVYELDRKEFFGSRLTVEHVKHGPRPPGEIRSGYQSRRGGFDRGGRLTVEHATGTPRDGGFRGGDRDSRRDGGGYRGNREDRGGRQRPYNTEWRIIVQNLSSRVGWQDLKDFFRSAGEVTFTKANKEKVGEGVVEFQTYKEMQKAMKKFDGAEFFDRKIKLIDDSPGPPRDSRSKSRSRSRSRRRSVSRSRSRERRFRSRSRSPKSKSKSRSPRRSKSPSRSRSRSQSRSRSRSTGSAKEERRSKSRSKSPEPNGET